MKIKKLCLANGDEYDDAETEFSINEFKKAISKGTLIEVRQQNKTIMINTAYIISLELGGEQNDSKKIKVFS